jgi:hypothetical protein
LSIMCRDSRPPGVLTNLRFFVLDLKAGLGITLHPEPYTETYRRFINFSIMPGERPQYRCDEKHQTFY